MTRKMILGGLVPIAFIAGSLATSSIAFAQAGGVGNHLIANEINALTQAVLGIPAVQGPPGPEGPEGPPGGIIGFYKVREQLTVTADEAMDGAVREASCDAGDFPISVGWFASSGNTIEGMSVSSDTAGGSAGVFVTNLREGSSYGVGVNCADFSPAHQP